MQLGCAKRYQPPVKDIWQGRADGMPKEYFYGCVQPIDLTELPIPSCKSRPFSLIGFACDAGVVRNQGRAGAASGPEAIRTALASLPVGWAQGTKVYDLGTITCTDSNLEPAQASLAEVVSLAIQAGTFPIIIGGGHETAWGTYQGLASGGDVDELGIVNLDAHFDLRDLLPGKLGSSGTPFHQIALARAHDELEFDYTCLGVQPSSNTRCLFDRAATLGVHCSLASDLRETTACKGVSMIDAAANRNDQLYASICMDAFSAALAPGVSAPQVLGLELGPAMTLVQTIARQKNLAALDVVECAPCFDRDGITASLAAKIIWTIMHGVAE